MVADRAQGAGQEFHDGTLHRRQDDEIQAAGFRQQRMQSIHGRQTRARQGIKRSAANGKGYALIEAENLTLTPSHIGKGKGLFEKPVLLRKGGQSRELEGAEDFVGDSVPCAAFFVARRIL